MTENLGSVLQRVSLVCGHLPIDIYIHIHSYMCIASIIYHSFQKFKHHTIDFEPGSNPLDTYILPIFAYCKVI